MTKNYTETIGSFVDGGNVLASCYSKLQAEILEML